MTIDIYLDSADLESIRQGKKNPLVKGFTTNPTLMAKAGIKDYEAFAKEALQIVDGLPISFEVFSDDFADMERQARKISSWGSNVYVKIPITNTKGEGSEQLVRRLTDEGINCNVTAICTVYRLANLLEWVNNSDALIVSVFNGRIADTGTNPCHYFYKVIPNEAKSLWASPREVFNIYQAIDMDYDIITVTPELLAKYEKFKDKGLDELSLETVKMFYDDAQKSEFSL